MAKVTFGVAASGEVPESVVDGRWLMVPGEEDTGTLYLGYNGKYYNLTGKTVTQEGIVGALGYTPVNPSVLSLGIASDGFIYLFVNGVPVGTGVPQGTSGDVFGYIDENNTVVLKGNLADGTYNIKYEMDDGSVLDIGDLTLGEEKVYYSVSKNLTDCVINNNTVSVAENESYSATISANNGYELSSIVVTMGGTDITSSVVSGGVVTITNVIGDVVITAVAEETTVEIVNLAQPDATATGETAWNSGGWCNNSYIAGSSYAYRSATDGRITTNTFAVEYGDTIYVKGIKYTSASYMFMACLNAAGEGLYHGSATNLVDNGYITEVTDINGDDYFSFVNTGNKSTDVGVRIIRISGYPSGDITDIIITRNQPIV